MFSINNAAHILQGGFIVFLDMTLTLLSVLANIMVISAVRDRYSVIWIGSITIESS